MTTTYENSTCNRVQPIEHVVKMTLITRAVSPILLGIVFVASCSHGQDSSKTLTSKDPTSPVKLSQYEAFALTHEGDADRGRQLYLDEKVAKCAICHKVGESGGQVGPDLSHIGGKFDRPHLIESLLEPSRQIVENYRTSVLALADGRVETGIIKRESGDSVTLLDVEGKERTIATSDIDERRESFVSLMPVGLVNDLSPAQFTDVVAYLETLRTGGKPTPGAAVAGAIRLPDGFEIETITTGLSGATALETLADGRVLVCEQTGALRVVKEGQLLAEPMLSLEVDSTWERGLIGVTVDPEFPESPYLFVCYVAEEPFPHHRISRFTVRGDSVVPGSEKRLLTGDDQTKLGGNVPAGHQGGAVHFGMDGKLYIGIGEQTAKTPSQDLGSFQGKLLRIDRDGSIPDDNPFASSATGKYRSIWALGLRNPFTFAFSQDSGDLLINDVGGESEEINRGVAGANYGWPTVDHGPTDDARFRGPVHHYPQASISGGDFLSDESRWPRRFRRRYFFADFVHGWIKSLDPTEDERTDEDLDTFATGLNRPVDLRFARDGSLYVLLRNAWVIDGKFQGGTGSLLRIYNVAR
jgi:putative heme-binding domain-containing protein